MYETTEQAQGGQSHWNRAEKCPLYAVIGQGGQEPQRKMGEGVIS